MWRFVLFTRVQQQAVAKWDGHLPEVVGSSGVLPMLGNLNVGK
ncbi:hypothetical protein [Trinickia dinghuensis]|nr:hypothetical protein [Trinickia dinghuensis]